MQKYCFPGVVECTESWNHMQIQKRNGLKNITMQKLGKSCNESTRLGQHDCSFAEKQEEGREICLCRLFYVQVI